MSDGWEDVAFGPPATPTVYGQMPAGLTPTDILIKGTSTTQPTDVWEDVAIGPAAVQAPRTWTETATDLGKSLIKGASHIPAMGEVVLNFNPFNPLAEAIGLKERPAPVNELRTEYVGDPLYRNAGLAERATSEAIGAIPLAVMGGGIPAAMASGAGGELGKAIGLPEWVGQIGGGFVPGAARSVAGKVAKSIGGDDFLATAKSLEQQALGARYNDYLKSAKNDFIDPTLAADDVETALRANIQEVVDRGTFEGVAKDPKSLWKANATKIKESADEVSGALKDVDQGLNGIKIFPKKSAFTNAKDYIKRASVTEDDDLAEYLDKFVEKLKSKSDGSVAFLQKEKRALQGKVYAGKDVGKEVIDKYIASDIRKLIEQTSDRVLGKDKANLIKELNHKLETHFDLDTILRRTLAKDEGSSAAASAVQAERTSGGTLTGPTLKGLGFGSTIGAAIGAPVGVPALGAGVGGAIGGSMGYGYGKTLGYLTSQEGKFATADRLRTLAPLREKYGPLADAVLGAGLVSSGIQSGVIAAQPESQNSQAGAQSSFQSLQTPAIGTPGISSSKIQPQAEGGQKGSFESNQEKDKELQQRRESSVKKSSPTAPNLELKKSSSNDVDVTPRTSQLKSDVKALISKQPKYVQAIIQTESAGNPKARSKAGAYGLMQLMPGTAEELKVDPKDPKQNIEGGTRYVKSLIKKYDDARLAFAAYNAGPRRVDRAIKLAKIAGRTPTWSNVREYLPEETKNYVPKIFNAYSKLTEA